MEKTKNMKIYRVKDIYIGYITTLNPDAIKKEDRFEQDIIALKRVKNEKGEYIYTQIDEKIKYYTAIDIVSLSSIINRGGFIKSGTITKIVQLEKQNKTAYNNPINLTKLNEKSKFKHQDITSIERELDINKSKKLMTRREIA